MDYDYKKIEEKMKSLPEDLQRAMASVQTANIIQDIAEKYKLTVDQTGQLFDLTGYIMLGLIPSRKFLSELVKQLEVDKETADQIANDVNSDVFGGIRASLQKIQADEAASESMNDSVNSSTTKESVLSSIENPLSSPTTTPINLLAEEYPMIIPDQKSGPTQSTPTAPVAPTPTKSLNMMDRFMSAPVSAKNETVEKKVGDMKPADAPKARIPSGPDPYREPIDQ